MAEPSPTAEFMEPVTDMVEEINGDNLIAFASLAGAVIVAIIVHAIIYSLLMRASGKSSDRLFFRMLRKTRTVSRIGIAILAAEMVLPMVSMPDEWRVIIDRVIIIVLIGVCGWLLNQLVNAVTDARLQKYDLSAEDNLEARKISTRMNVLSRMMTMLILLITLAAMLMTFPSVRSIGISLFASAGVAGIVIGFAARPVLSNLLAGIQIALTQPIRIGDAVIMEGEWGWIDEITSTYVVVKIWDWRRLVVPLTQVIEKPFQNWTRENSSIIGSVTWHLDYTAPVGDIREKLQSLLKESERWDGDVAVLQVIDTTEETMTLRGLMSAKNSPIAWDLRCEIREKMIAWLQSDHPGALPRRRGLLHIDETSAVPTPTESPAPEQDSGMSEKIDHPDDDV
ncbi:mechanosensitive ion channel family protein [Ponticaulis sp.]|uniref:mechanosensitive ion channel family protein n=1 Tax=Ponticaulis sp. TaxID=2020902 RepID=UPI000B66C007|nr:mechanosensitive ion channel family protein [Ponticaulis sp.]MAI90235.1 mechanosensitive ion channel protein MscS [Ponticaulis sp.]OUX99881.1 MAG: hypothetical protein CBB65_07325 [Hyphomonadaceae bacterium TMED5]|tara:strand:- start:210840 stop:212027 length:1188 start_codon:yes stop_codon:yes gene_type:complete